MRYAISGLFVGVLAGVVGCSTPDPKLLAQAESHRRLAVVNLDDGNLPTSIRHYRSALKLDPKNVELHFGISEAYRRKRKLALAETHLLKALRLDPEHPDARLNLGVVYLQLERWQDSIRENTVLIEDPTFLRPARALVNRGWAHYKSGNVSGAETDFREALAQEGRNYHAHLNLGIVLFDRGEVLDAMKHFNRVLELLENRPRQLFGFAESETRYHLAKAHVKVGQLGKAIEQLQVAAEIGGDGEWGRRSEEYLAVLR